MTEAWSETADSVEEFGDEFSDEIIEGVNEVIGDDPGVPDESEAGPGIPDEPEAFVEELRAAADLPETGEPRVDEVLAGLSGIENLPTADHVGIYDQVHRGLQDALANLDQG